MTVYELMAKLGAAGIRLWVEDGQLKFKAPKGALTPELKQSLIEKKPQVIEFLSETRVANTETESDIPRVDRSLPIPLSHAQQRLWFVEQLTPGSSTFHIPAALVLNGILDASALEQAFLQLLERHEALRTVFRQGGGEPVQEILEVSSFTIPCESLLDLPESDRLARVTALAEAEIRRSFDLEKGPLVRARLFQLDDNQHGLIVTMHHIVTDGWSMGIFVSEIAALYAAARVGAQPSLPVLPIQYADFAAWQREWLSGDELERQLSYWRRTLQNAPEELKLPFDRPRPALQTLNGATLNLLIDKRLTENLRKLARQFDTTLYVILLSAYNLVLSKWSRQTDFCVGMPIAGRTRGEIEHLIGFFVNTLVIRSNVAGNPSCADLIRQTRESVLAAQSHQDVPFEAIVEAINTPRNLSFSPLCQVALSMTGAEGTAGKVVMGGLEISPMKIDLVAARLDLTLMLVDHGDWVDGMLEFNTDLFDHSTMQVFSQHLLTVLDQFCANLDQRIAAIQLYSDCALLESSRVPAQLEAVLPLTPEQESRVSCGTADPEPASNGYFVVFSGVSETQLVDATRYVSQGHPLFRSSIEAYCLPGSDPYYFNVWAHAPECCEILDWQDSTFDDASLEEKLGSIKISGFISENVATLRYVVVKLPQGKVALVVKAHPAILAVASFPHHLQEVLLALSGQHQTSTSVIAVRQFIDGQRSQHPAQETLTYWAEQLQDYQAPAVKQRTVGAMVTQRWVLSDSQRQQIERWCQREGVTPGAYFRTLFVLGLQQQYYFSDQVLINSSLTSQACLSGAGYELILQQPRVDNSFLSNLQRDYNWGADHAGVGILPPSVRSKFVGADALDFQYHYLTDVDPGLINSGLTEVLDRPLSLSLVHPGAVSLVINACYQQLGLELSYCQGEFAAHDLLARIEQVHNAIQSGLDVLDGLPWLFTQERKSLLEYGDGARSEVGPLLLERFASQVQSVPDNVAVICGAHSMSYTELDRLSNRVARWLQTKGVGLGSRVALCIGRSADLLGIYLGVIKAGAAYIPLDLNYPTDRIRFILEDSDAPILIASESVYRQIGETGDHDQSDKVVSVDILMADLSGYQDGPIAERPSAEDVLYYVYTSGSTGKPKGAGVRHLAEANLLDWYSQLLQCSADDRFLLMSALGFDLTQKNLFAPICNGSALVIPESDDYDPDHLVQLIHRHHVTVVNCAPSAFYPFLDSADRIASLKHVVLGGEPIRTELLQNWMQRDGVSVTVTNSYGPTECTDVVACFSVSDGSKLPSSLPIGYPCPNTHLYIVNRYGELMPKGVVGELRVGGVGVGAGYWQRQDLNATMFQTNPYGEGNWYRTGDLCRFNLDNTVEYIGRADFQVKLRGLRIEPGEIDNRLKQIEGVKDALSMVVQDNLVSYVLTDAQLEPEALQQRLASELPAFMIPSSIISLECWPLSPNGKIDRKALPLPGADVAKKMVSPRNTSEQQLAAIWCEVLGLPAVGVTSNFFELGGHSLLATQVVSRVRKQFGVEISVRALFEAPTIEQLVSCIARSASLASISAPPLEPCENPNRDTLSFAQYRLWFVDQLNQGSSEYNLPSALRIDGALNVVVLDRVFGEIVSRHEVLRTNFAEENGVPKLVVHEAKEWHSDFTDLCHLSALEREEEVTRLVDREAARVFNLQTDLLFHTHIIKLSETSHVLLLNMHHIVSDGWSVGILIQEVQALYPAFSVGNVSPLPALPVQYSDFALWQREWLQGDVMDDLRSYWQTALMDAPDVLRLPTDKPRPKHQTFNGAHLPITLGTELSDRLASFCDQRDLTPFMVLMGAYQVMLARYSGQRDICVGIPIAGRNRAEVEGLIGFFINGLVIRTRMEDNPSVEEYLRQVKEVSLGAYAHQDMPADVLLDTLKMERSADTSPGAQVGFALQNLGQDSIQGEMAGLVIAEIQREHKTAKYELSLILQENSDGLGGVFEYNTDLFEANTIERMGTHFKQLLGQMLEQPESMLDQLQMVALDDLYPLLQRNPSLGQLRRLSPMQRDMVLDDMLEPGTLKNSLGYHFIVDGPFDAEQWRVACLTIARQQPALRARILPSSLPFGDVAYLDIPNEPALDFTIDDWSHRKTTDQAAADYARNLIWQPYELTGSLSQYYVYRLDCGRHLVVFRMNHIILDGAGMAVHLKEAIACLEAMQTGDSYISVADIFPQYVHDNTIRTDRSEVIKFWKQQRVSLEALDFSLPPEHSPEHRRIQCQLRLSGQHWQQVQDFCRENRITPSLYFKALYGLLINSYCRGEDDFYISEVVGGRTGEQRRAFGNYFQIMPVVFPKQLFQKGETVAALFDHIRQYRKSLRGNAFISLMSQRRLLPRGRLQFMFNYYNFIPSIKLFETEVKLTAYPQLQDGPVQFVVHEQDGWVELNLIYLDDLFADLNFLERVEQLSHKILQGCGSIDELDLRLASEQLATTPDLKAVATLPHATVVHGFIAQVDASPDAIAVQHASRSLTYRELHLQSSSLAAWLQQQGVKSNSRVAVCLDRSVDMLVAVLGVLKTGAAYVPMDANYPAQRLAYILEDSSASVLLTHKCVNARLSDDLQSSQVRVLELDGDSLWHTTQPDEPLSLPNPEHSIYVIYTSGSTGKPKGAEVNHAGEINLQNWYLREMGFTQEDRFLLMSAFGFDLTQKNLFAPLLVGATLVIPDMQEYDLNVVAKTLKESAITVVNCAPSAFYPLVEDPGFTGYPFPDLKHLILGGEPIRLDALRGWLETVDCRLVNSYGPTECTDVVAWHVYDSNSDVQGLPLGRAIDNTQLFVVDSADHLLPPGMVGELCIAGQGVGEGYVNQPQLTEKVFNENPYGPGRWYRTGDLVRLRADGGLDYIGRKDFQVKIRGLRIELGEVESALKQLPEVSDSLTVVINEQLVSYLIAPKSVSTESVRSALRSRLPDYMIPSAVVAMTAWPLTPNGKIDRQALPAPEHSERPAYVAPTTATEIALAAIWTEVLGIEQIGIHDSFFDLGGHSLLAARAVARLRQEFSVDIQLRSLFELHTITDIAQYLDTMQWAARNAEQEQVSGSSPTENRDEGFL